MTLPVLPRLLAALVLAGAFAVSAQAAPGLAGWG